MATKTTVLFKNKRGSQMKKYYENFVRDAFTLVYEKRVGRHGDPAAMADTDCFDESEIDAVKAATGYAMCILRNEVVKLLDMTEAEPEDKKMHDFVSSVIAASSLKEIHQVIRSFRSEVIDKYYTMKDGLFLVK